MLTKELLIVCVFIFSSFCYIAASNEILSEIDHEEEESEKPAGRKRERGGRINQHRVRLYGWNGFIHLNHYDATICTVPKVGSTAIRKWTLDLAPTELRRCIAEIEADNAARLAAPHCKDLDSFRNMTKYKQAGMTRYKLMCRIRSIEPSELLFGRDSCVKSTLNYTVAKNLNIKFAMSRALITFVRHPIDRFVSWFVDKALTERSKVHIPGAFDFKRFYSYPGFGASNMINYLWKRRDFFTNCSIDYDDHYHSQSCVCLHKYINYTFIGKLETMERDFKSMVKLITSKKSPRQAVGDLHPLSSVLPGKLNEHKWSDSANYVRHNITAEDAKKLYDIYRNDFELFGYSVNEWFNSRLA